MILGLDAALRTAARLALLNPDPTIQVAHLCIRPRGVCPLEAPGMRQIGDAELIASVILKIVLGKPVFMRCPICEPEDIGMPDRSLS